MACYDCEDCKYNYQHGGNCERWEYNCPYAHLDSMTENDRNLLLNIKKKVEELELLKDKIEGDFYHDDIFRSLDFVAMQIEELVDLELVKEYKAIKGDDNNDNS